VTKSSLLNLKSDVGRSICHFHIYKLSASAASLCNSPTEREVEDVPWGPDTEQNGSNISQA